MIVNFLLDFIYYVVALLITPLRLLDDVEVIPSISTAMNTVVGYIRPLNSLIPEDFWFILGIVVSIEAGLAVAKLVIKFLRG